MNIHLRNFRYLFNCILTKCVDTLADDKEKNKVFCQHGEYHNDEET